MKYSFLIVAALALAMPLSAFAQDTRMSDGRYIAASRCIAYADLPQLSNDAFDASALRLAVESQPANPLVRDRVRDDSRDARFAGRRAGDNERALQTLRNRRDDACANFVSNGLVQAAPPAPAS